MTDAEVVAHQKHALLAQCPESVLIYAVRDLDPLQRGTLPGDDVRRLFAWVCDELEARHPEVAPPLDAWCDSGWEGPTYGSVLLGELAKDAL